MSNMKEILIGMCISICITIILLGIFSIILANTNIGEETMAPVIVVISGISLLVGSSIATTKIKKNGIVNGVIIGGIYMIGLYLISITLMMNYTVNTYTIIMITIGMLCGGIGGIVGVNLKW